MEVELDTAFEGLLVPESQRVDLLVDGTVVLDS